ncbi:hypothetical protein LCGC14_1777850 [marine sediment metagenome]|uniref:Uncharacterized protein n=1 Tax=marine sediment metagenome TaxID=412755 RepID=A0A0F9GW79_9ZZZZ|nr:hypothetical protein [Porticoccus sp.]
MTEENLKELRKQITVVFRKFSVNPHHTPLKREQDCNLMGRFIDKLNSSEFDTGSLPYFSKTGLAAKPSKVECVFALACSVVLSYWAIAHPQDGVDHELSGCYENNLKGHIARLNKVYNEFDKLKLLGDAKGYCLFESQREDLYGSKESKPENEVQVG